jgi:hypothetical protein
LSRSLRLSLFSQQRPRRRDNGNNEAKISRPTTVSVFATGFNNPRGLEWGPDGNLYVAEGGLGGSDSTVGQCAQVDPPIGPYTGSTNDPVNGGRISMVTPAGVRTTLASGLPSSMTAADSGNLVSGVSDVAFVGGQMYALLAGAGCSHGVADVPNGVVRVASDGSWTGLTVGPDGAFYVSGQGFGFPAGQGQVLRITAG